MNSLTFPDYAAKSLLNIPSTILSLFGAKPLKPLLPDHFFKEAKDPDKIVLFLFDGFGNELYQKIGLKYDFFKNLKEFGFTSSITSVFPSTTAAALNTLYTGLSPMEHGLPEWYMYFAEFDCVLESLPFKPVDSQNLLKTQNPPKDILVKDKTIFQYLSDVGIRSVSLVPKELEDSFYTKSSLLGSTIIGYEGLVDLSKRLTELTKTMPGKVFFSVYCPNIDSAEHRFGVYSKEVETEIAQISKTLQDEFVEKVDSKFAENISIMLSADHGQITVDLKDAVYLDEIEGLVECLKIGPSGLPIPPTSGTRNAFLQIQEEKLDFAIALLEKNLLGKAEVIRMADAIKMNLFGLDESSDRFLNRAGNALLIALSGYTLVYHYTKGFEFKLIGRHGGLSKAEMIIPFACARLSELKIKVN